MEEESSDLNALEELIKEHEAVLSHLDTLALALGALEKEQVNFDSEAFRVVEEVIRLLRTDLGLHLRKEEEILFPVLSPSLGKEGGPIGVMLREHEGLRQILLTLNNAMVVFRADPQTASLKEILQGCQDLISLLRQHIQKEDNCLFPMANSNLTQTRLQDLGVEMRAMDPGTDRPQR
jgi:hemerythrin-like domain-containing protein